MAADRQQIVQALAADHGVQRAHTGHLEALDRITIAYGTRLDQQDKRLATLEDWAGLQVVVTLLVGLLAVVALVVAVLS